MSTENNIKVSVVIVCMNNLKNLYPCLESIRRYTHVSYETFVVAYLFSKENLERVKADFPWVTFIESNEIRGFSENNNLALRQARGEYCFVVNDDTEMKMPVIDMLVDSFLQCPSTTAVVSPRLVFKDGSTQVCGRPPYGIKEYLLGALSLWKEQRDGGKWVNQIGLFESYNIIGAAFMIKNDIFREYGYFDERYFFCPEDIALSTELNHAGYTCYVNSDCSIVHYEGGSGSCNVSRIKAATAPAGELGTIIFLSDGRIYKNLFLRSYILIINSLKAILYTFKTEQKYKILRRASINTCKALLSNKTPKEIFQKYYSQIIQNR